MHALMATQVGKLRVALSADFAAKRFHRAMDMRVLFEAARGRERFAALGTSVTSGSDVMRSNVPLQVARIRKDLFTVFAVESAIFAVNHFMP